MMNKLGGSITGVAAVLAIVWLTGVPAAAQPPAAVSTLRRTADGKPDLNGIWQALNTAAWNIQDHSGQLGVPPGQGVVEGNEIPYQPWAAAKKQQNFANRMTADPTEGNCYLPGVPRATYISPHPEGLPGTWMGDSRGRWEGNTLVVDVRNFNDETWFDRAGNFHSDELHVVERYTLTDSDHILYEATIEDPKVFTGPWKISMPLYRRVEKNAKLLEYECVYYLQEERFKNAPFKR